MFYVAGLQNNTEVAKYVAVEAFIKCFDCKV
jgi:hypothetical protein